ncbi:MAG: peptidylprolyl isomerase [Blastocatellia bacterium]|nr:peptidylprolyl isomerase [Blastocatellia bacterium]
MNQKLIGVGIFCVWFFAGASAQLPTTTHIQILKAEDARRYDKTLAVLFKNGSEKVRVRAALAAGRIGDERAIPALTALLEKDTSTGVRAMAAFALGEIESINGADAILNALKAETRAVASVPVTARAVEAAGKIAAANAKDERSKVLAEALLDTLESENNRGTKQSREVVLLALTAALRAAPKDTKRERPDKTDSVVAKFLTSVDARVRADAANTLSRVRAKNGNEALRKMLSTDADPIARANAARALGSAEDKDALNILLDAATEDKDSRVRVSALRALAALKDAKAAEPLLARGEELFTKYKAAKKPNFIPNETSEFIEVATALGRILPNTDNQRADKLFADFGKIDKGHSPDVYIARIRIGQKRGDGSSPELTDWKQYSSLAQVIGEYASIEPVSEIGKQLKTEAPTVFRPLVLAYASADPATEGKRMLAGPDVLQAYARFKTADLGEIARTALQNKDVQMRAAAAGILADLPSSKENVEALKTAFTKALLTDKKENDAQLSILDALYKLDKTQSLSSLAEALKAPDYLVRTKVRELLKGNDGLWKNVIPFRIAVVDAVVQNKFKVLPYAPSSGTKLGQVLNTDVDYRRALSRKNGSVRAVLTTEKGAFTIEFFPEDAPLAVDNFIKLARARYFNGLEVHRVVPNFVMQDGDPRGDGNGGPGWSIRCEMNMRPYERGAVGMALSGKDTGGSQWFVTHSPQPHLDGGYTVFGRVSETDMLVVDKIARGDRVLSVRIVEERKH